MATRYKGKNLSLDVAGTEFNAEGTSVKLDSEDADDKDLTFLEFSEGGGGGRGWFFEVKALQDFGIGSFWSYLWDNAGETATYLFKPHGNADPTPEQPHFRGTLTIPYKPGFDVTAGETSTYEHRLDLDGPPEKITGAAA